MALSINRNLMAMNTARNLNSAYGNIATSTRRLSSGLRVGTAADDAAGLAIREMMRADISSLSQGVRNANDAISAIQTADGALQVVDEKLIRMKELATQAATGTYTSDQRLIINSEYQAMALEIERISRATDFNGIKLLDGSLDGAHNGSGLNSAGNLKVHFGSGNSSAEDYYYLSIKGSNLKAIFDPDGTAVGGVSANSIGLYKNKETQTVVSDVTPTGIDNTTSSSATLKSGDIAVSWTEMNFGTGFQDVYGRILSPDGSVKSNIFTVNTDQSSDKTNVKISSLEDGGFLATWTSATQDGSGSGVYLQRMSEDGTKVGPETLINTTTGGDQDQSSVVGTPSDGLISVWRSNQSGANEVYCKVLDNNNAVVKDEFLISGSTDDTNPNVFELDNGTYMATWRTNPVGWASTVKAQLMDKDGALIGGGFDITDTFWTSAATNALRSNFVTPLGNGTFVAVYKDEANGSNMMGQIFSNTGAPVGNKFFVTSVASADPSDVKVLADGNFAVQWKNASSENGWVKIFDPSGTALGNEIPISYIFGVGAAGPQSTTLSALDDGGFAVSYIDVDDVTGGKYVAVDTFRPLINVSTQSMAQSSVTDVDVASVQVNKIRASLGATQNRLDNTIQNLQIQGENLQAAESQISDVDVAQEMTSMVSNQILAQSATAMLAQANSLPKMALQLIQG